MFHFPADFPGSTHSVHLVSPLFSSFFPEHLLIRVPLVKTEGWHYAYTQIRDESKL
jgi:hypothetical protein